MPVMDEFQQERDNMKNQPFKKRAEYFWEYNKWRIIGSLIAIIVLAFVIHSAVTKKKEVLYIALVNCSEALNSSIEQDVIIPFLEQHDLDPKKNTVVFDSDFVVGFNRTVSVSSEGDASHSSEARANGSQTTTASQEAKDSQAASDSQAATDSQEATASQAAVSQAEAQESSGMQYKSNFTASNPSRSRQNLSVFITAGQIDLLCCSETSFDDYAYKRIIAPLSELFTEAELLEYKEYLYYIDWAVLERYQAAEKDMDYNYNEPFPASNAYEHMEKPTAVGFIIDNADCISNNYGFLTEEKDDHIVTGIVVNSSNKNMAKDMLIYLMKN